MHTCIHTFQYLIWHITTKLACKTWCCLAGAYFAWHVFAWQMLSNHLSISVNHLVSSGQANTMLLRNAWHLHDRCLTAACRVIAKRLSSFHHVSTKHLFLALGKSVFIIFMPHHKSFMIKRVSMRVVQSHFIIKSFLLHSNKNCLREQLCKMLNFISQSHLI